MRAGGARNITAFIENGERPWLISLIIDNFKNFVMTGKYHVKISAPRIQPGLQAQRATHGNKDVLS